MALADRLEAGPDRRPKGPVCSLGLLLQRLPAGEAAALRSMLDDGAWPTSAIGTALADEGYLIGRHPLARHRAGGCSCTERGLR